MLNCRDVIFCKKTSAYSFLLFLPSLCHQAEIPFLSSSSTNIILIKPEKKLNLTTRLFFGIVSFVLNPSVLKRAHAIPHIRIRIKAFITVMTRNFGRTCEFRPLENPCYFRVFKIPNRILLCFLSCFSSQNIFE